jgi:hypothetical protein
MQTDEKNNRLFDMVRSLRDKALIASNIRKHTPEKIDWYKKLFNNYSIGKNSKDVIVLLNITINLCLCCVSPETDDKIKPEILCILNKIKSITQGTITESAYKVIEAGLNYVYAPSEETKNAFIDNMGKVYHPYSAAFLFEDADE